MRCDKYVYEIRLKSTSVGISEGAVTNEFAPVLYASVVNDLLTCQVSARQTSNLMCS